MFEISISPDSKLGTEAEEGNDEAVQTPFLFSSMFSVEMYVSSDNSSFEMRLLLKSARSLSVP